MVDTKGSNLRNILHGFFLAVAMTIAEPSTIFPLIISYFTDNAVIIGLFAALLRGGSVAIQMYAAYHAQGYKKVMPYMRGVFFFRFLSWFFIGISIFLFGSDDKELTLWLMGIGLFFFSFTAGYGEIFFKEILAKVFSKSYRGKTMANRHFFASMGSLISGGVAGYVLTVFEAPDSYAYLFMISAFLMGIGFFAFSTIKEPEKQNITKKDTTFLRFVANSFSLLKTDKRLRYQTITILLGFSYLFSLPFIILQAKESFELTGWLIGGFVTVEMLGSMFGNLFLWKKFSGNYIRMLTLAYLIFITVIVLAFISFNIVTYVLLFFLFGMARDGFMNASLNLVLEIAPEEKRPVYVAVQSNITGIGYFFALPGGMILEAFGYSTLFSFTLVMFIFALYFISKMKESHG